MATKSRRRNKTESEPKCAFDELNDRQQSFVVHYLGCLNATKAYQAVGYKSKTPSQDACNLVRNPKVAAAIREGLDKAGITAEKLKVALGQVVFDGSLADFEPWIAGEKTLKQLEADGVNVQLLESAGISDKGARRATIHNRIAAAKELVRVLGLASETRRLEGKVGVTIEDVLDELDREDAEAAELED